LLPEHEWVGRAAGPYEEDVSLERIQAFCRAAGARETRIAPPTFLTVCRRGEYDILTELGIELKQVLHGEQEYKLEQDILPGDRLSYTTRLAQAVNKQRAGAGALRVLIFETEVQTRVQGTDSVWKRVGVARTTVLVRG
jgi:hypothetical protein